MLDARDIGELQEVIGYRFADSRILEVALTHRSFANELRPPLAEDNEKLEFLGDAVLDLLIGHELMERFPDLDEGALSMTRAQLVSETGLAEIARRIQLGDWLRLGRGEEKTGGREKPSLLSDAFEALCAAIYLDGGFSAARGALLPLFEASFEQLRPSALADHKTRLQELVQGRLKTIPEYRVVDESGPDHDKTFEVAVVVAGIERARAIGKSKKAAEQVAAEAAADSFAEWSPSVRDQPAR